MKQYKTDRVRGAVVEKIRSATGPFTIFDIPHFNIRSTAALLRQLTNKGELKRIKRGRNRPSVYERQTIKYQPAGKAKENNKQTCG